MFAPRPARRRLLVPLVGAATLSVVAAAFPLPAGAGLLQPVTVAVSANGVAGGPAYTGEPTTVALTVTNKATNGAKLGVFSIVIPKGVTSFALGTATGPGGWSETKLSCGRVSPCSAILLVAAKSSLLPPGGSVTATFSFVAPAAPTTLTFPLLGIGGGLFAVSGPPPSLAVVDPAPTALAVGVAGPVVAGSPATVTVTATRSGGLPARFPGGTVRFALGAADPAATFGGSAVGAGGYVDLVVGAQSSGVFTVPLVATVAQLQSVSATWGALSDTSDPFTVLAGPPAVLVIDSLTDTSNSPALPTPAAGQPFAVTFHVLDAFGNAATSPDVTATLTAGAGPGTLTAPPVLTSGGTGTVTATYSAATAALALTLSSPGLTSDSVSTPVVTAGDSSDGSPGTLTAGPAGAALPAGAVGPVFLTVAPCVSTPDAPCPGSSEITLAGRFTTDAGQELYSYAHPAKVTWTCLAADCPHRDGGHYGATGHWWDFHWDALSATLKNKRAVVEDFVDYPMEVSMFVDGAYQPYGVAPSCVDLANKYKIGLTGVIDSAAAKAAGYCVDVYAITRSVTASSKGCQSYFGDLTLPVLFVEDPKMRPA